MHLISEWTLIANEYYDVTREVQEAPYTPKLQSELDDDAYSEESDEDFSWFKLEEGHNDECHFVYINQSRKTI